MANKKTLLLLCSTLCAGAVAALLALALVSGPAVSQEIRPAAKTGSAVAAACETATWPNIPERCLTRAGAAPGQRPATVRRIALARPVARPMQ